MNLNLDQINAQLMSGVIFNTTDILTVLIKYYEEAIAFNESLHDDSENLQFISEDLMKIGRYLPTIGKVKSTAKILLENNLSSVDEKWRKNNLADYKQSSKSSTTHQINLRGLNEIAPYALAYELISTIYLDLNTKFKSLQFVGSNLKFEIEKGLATYTINRTIK